MTGRVKDASTMTIEQVIEQLSPCPWCKTNKHLRLNDFDLEDARYVVCDNCVLGGPFDQEKYGSVVDDYSKEQIIAMIIETWNRWRRPTKFNIKDL